MDDVDIFSAAAFGEYETLRELLSKARAAGCSQPALERDAFGSTILIEAAKLGHVAACRVALEEGADVSAADAMGRTALHWAAGGGRIDAVELLVTAGAPVSGADARGDTPLHHASRGGYDRVVSRLIAAGANAAVAGALDWTASFRSRTATTRGGPDSTELSQMHDGEVAASAAGPELSGRALGGPAASHPSEVEEATRAASPGR